MKQLKNDLLFTASFSAIFLSVPACFYKCFLSSQLNNDMSGMQISSSALLGTLIIGIFFIYYMIKDLIKKYNTKNVYSFKIVYLKDVLESKTIEAKNEKEAFEQVKNLVNTYLNAEPAIKFELVQV